MSTHCPIYVLFASLLILIVLLRRYISSKSQPSLPPGPRGLPVIGNLLDMPSEQEWFTFARWGEQYGAWNQTQRQRIPTKLRVGDICSVTILGQPLVILNSAKSTWDMLDKKSSIYSDRPVLEMGGELVGWKNTLALLPYGDRFRRYRKLFHQLIGSSYAMSRFWSIEEDEMRRFLRRVIARPDDLSSHIRRCVKSTGRCPIMSACTHV